MSAGSLYKKEGKLIALKSAVAKKRENIQRSRKRINWAIVGINDMSILWDNLKLMEFSK